MRRWMIEPCHGFAGRRANHVQGNGRFSNMSTSSVLNNVITSRKSWRLLSSLWGFSALGDCFQEVLWGFSALSDCFQLLPMGFSGHVRCFGGQVRGFRGIGANSGWRRMSPLFSHSTTIR